MNRDPEHFNKLKGKKKLKEEKKKKKDIAQHRGSKAISAKAVSFASSRLFTEQIHCLSCPKVTTPKYPSCSQWRCFPYWKQMYFDTPDAVLPKLPSCQAASHVSHLHHYMSLGQAWGQGGFGHCLHQLGLALAWPVASSKAPVQAPCHQVPLLPIPSGFGENLAQAKAHLATEP